MTVLPPGPDATACVTDEIVEAAVEAYHDALCHTPVELDDDAAEKHIARYVLDRIALMIVAAYQHAEEAATCDLPPEIMAQVEESRRHPERDQLRLQQRVTDSAGG